MEATDDSRIVDLLMTFLPDKACLARANLAGTPVTLSIKAPNGSGAQLPGPPPTADRSPQAPVPDTCISRLVYFTLAIGFRGGPKTLRPRACLVDGPPALFAHAVEYPRPKSLHPQVR
jgi:hypothetical protein